MNTEEFLNSIVTIIDETGEITSYKKEVGLLNNEILYKYVSNNYPQITVHYSDTSLYETICKLDKLSLLNFGKVIRNREEKYDFCILIPDTISDTQKSLLKEFLEIKNEHISSLTVYKYDKETNKLSNLRYEEKLKYGIDELKLILNKKIDISKKVIDIFYTDIIPSIIKGRTVIDDISYHVNYNVMIDNKPLGIINSDIPTLMIKNVDEFNKYLVMYIEKQSEFLLENIFVSTGSVISHSNSDEQIRYCLMNLFVNATSYDFNNPIEFLKLRISFLDNEFLNKEFPIYKNIYELDDIDCHIESCVYQQHPTNETPYAFCSRIVSNNENDSYDLPKIRYGIKDDGNEKSVYVYGIQGSKKKNVLTKFEKKINRYLFKINKGLTKDDEYLQYEKDKELGIDSYYPENIIDVTPKSVLALTIFLKVIKELDINKVTAVDYLPIRYFGNLKGKIATIDLSKGIYSEDVMKNKYLNAEQEMDDNQFNITNKFIRTFNRVNYHLNNMSIISYPYEIDDSIHFMINDNEFDNDNIINKIYNGITINDVKRK